MNIKRKCCRWKWRGWPSLPWHQPSCWGDSWLLQRGRTTHPQMVEYTLFTFRWRLCNLLTQMQIHIRGHSCMHAGTGLKEKKKITCLSKCTNKCEELQCLSSHPLPLGGGGKGIYPSLWKNGKFFPCVLKSKWIKCAKTHTYIKKNSPSC